MSTSKPRRSTRTSTKSTRSTESTTLQLNCLILSRDPRPRHIFRLEISDKKTVDDLREAIKDKRKPEFNHVAAGTLVLWKFFIPIDQSFTETLKTKVFDDEDSLLPVEELSEVFTEPLVRKHLHIVVKAPPASLLSQPSPLEASKSDEPFYRLENAQKRLIEGALGGPPPSSAAMSFFIEQEQRPIWNGRPSMNHGIPIQLYHHSFAKFLDIVRDDTVEIDLTPENYSTTHSLFHSSAMLYKSEAERVREITASLGTVIGRPIPAFVIHRMATNGGCDVNCGGIRALLALMEAKNEIGTGGSDPSHQCACGFRYYYTRPEVAPIRDCCCCPTFLIALAGPWMCILGAVLVDNVIVQQLTDFIWIGGHPYNDTKFKSVTRILASLGKGMDELDKFYRKLMSQPSHHDSQRFFPYIRKYDAVEFSYRDYLVNNSKAIFLAITKEEQSRNIVVKFVQSYNAEAHRHLAAADLAPQLFHCSTDRRLAGLTMVVMDYVEGETAHQRYAGELPQPIFDQVEKALEILHASNIVFGDLRPPNIMITEDERVRLIDFDWCGTHGEGTYPVSLNDTRNTIIRINWHPDVKRGGRMMKEHDTFMLSGMRPRSDPPLATTSQSPKQLGKRKARA